jgi:hypothetical protein
MSSGWVTASPELQPPTWSPGYRPKSPSLLFGTFGEISLPTDSHGRRLWWLKSSRFRQVHLVESAVLGPATFRAVNHSASIFES